MIASGASAAACPARPAPRATRPRARRSTDRRSAPGGRAPARAGRSRSASSSSILCLRARLTTRFSAPDRALAAEVRRARRRAKPAEVRIGDVREPEHRAALTAAPHAGGAAARSGCRPARRSDPTRTRAPAGVASRLVEHDAARRGRRPRPSRRTRRHEDVVEAAVELAASASSPMYGVGARPGDPGLRPGSRAPTRPGRRRAGRPASSARTASGSRRCRGRR